MSSSAEVPSAVTTGLVVVSAIFPVLSAVALYFRIVAVRRNTSRSSGWDEIWLLISWLTTLPISIVVWVVAARSGVDHYKIPVATGVKYSLALIWLCSVILNGPETAVKIAILIFYKRIFPTRTFAIFVWVGIAAISVWGIVFFCFTLTNARPISEPWSGHASFPYDTTALGLAQVGTNIGLDIVVLCFPLPVISRLHMPIGRKTAVSLIFWLGAFCCIASIVRLVLLKRSLAIIVDDPDQNIYLQANIIIWKIIEPNMSIVSACLPCYGPFLNSRTAESIVRSVRSAISLRSLRSGNRGSGNGSQGSGGRKNTAKTINDPTSESQIELSHQNWPGNGQMSSWVNTGKQGKLSTDTNAVEEVTDGLGDGIHVTNGVTVTRERINGMDND
ncbi:hypothetical protein VP1G_06167 [Cytospora mali]|uniref:Rhodopsin domain-containing protein n=1 Tax=Cytospora mali TaxID=578113 RepID=A0A194V4V0_CYTMA|nr:hypothetical protein VP1G_06167 [Valsa mali var. pyri (nom. inval.)]